MKENIPYDKYDTIAINDNLVAFHFNTYKTYMSVADPGISDKVG
jgi:hypothetical protein